MNAKAIHEFVHTLVTLYPDTCLTVPGKPWDSYTGVAIHTIALKLRDIDDVLRSWDQKMPGSAVIDVREKRAYRDCGLQDWEADELTKLAKSGPCGQWLAWMISEWHEGDPQEYLLMALLSAMTALLKLEKRQ